MEINPPEFLRCWTPISKAGGFEIIEGIHHRKLEHIRRLNPGVVVNPCNNERNYNTFTLLAVKKKRVYLGCPSVWSLDCWQPLEPGCSRNAGLPLAHQDPPLSRSESTGIHQQTYSQFMNTIKKTFNHFWAANNIAAFLYATIPSQVIIWD